MLQYINIMAFWDSHTLRLTYNFSWKCSSGFLYVSYAIIPSG